MLSLLLKIALGLVGLGIVVFVHEAGHFLAARLVGIDVEAFSIGWGKPFLRKKIGGVEYRLGIFPLGGYCKMKGENELAEAWQNKRSSIDASPGTYFGVAPWRRIITAFAGPFFNILFACVVFTVINIVPHEVVTLPNRVVLASEVDGVEYPADRAGLKTGDRIVEVDGKSVENYSDIQMAIGTRPDKDTRLVLDRDGRALSIELRPELDKSTGAGRAGVYAWIDPVLDYTVDGSAAAAAGLRAGDKIIAVNGERITNTQDFLRILTAAREAGERDLSLEYERERRIQSAVMTIPENGTLGLAWQPLRYMTPSRTLPAAFVEGASETVESLSVQVRSLAVLFKGIDLKNAISGPVRITYMAGDVAAGSFSSGFGEGLRVMFNFLSFISIALAVMNLLPLPILDGGLIVLFIGEAISGRPLHPRVMAVFQAVGIAIIAGLLIFAVTGDILFFAKK